MFFIFLCSSEDDNFVNEIEDEDMDDLGEGERKKIERKHCMCEIYPCITHRAKSRI